MGIVAVAKDVSTVVEAINKIMTLLKSLNRERSVVLEVQNLTASPLRRVSENHGEGGFAEPPSLEILPGQVDVFGSQSSFPGKGTKGRVIYESNDGFLLHVEWENPFLGSTNCKASVVGDNAANFRTDHTCGVGKEAHMQYIVEQGVGERVTILRKGSAEVGRVSEIAVIRSRAQALVTAVRTADETLKLIPWAVDNNGSISRLGNGAEAGEASDIDITRGRLFVSACRTAEENLRLISWEVEEDGTVRRRGENSDPAGDARNNKIIALSNTLFVTAVRTVSGKLKLIAWELANNNALERRDDSADEAGAVTEISLVRVSPDTAGNHRVVTSVRGGDGELVLITWSISTNGRAIKRLSFNHGQAGRVNMIRSVTTSSGRLVTSAKDSSGDLVLITWNVEGSGNLTRLADSHGQAGTIFDNALMSRPSGVLSAVHGTTGLRLIAWRTTAQGALERIGDSGDQADEASPIALCQEPLTGVAPIITAGRTKSGNLQLISWAEEPN